jgi:S-DNA-T family DNA segregation ATPase FtsK/SpoIIIE
MEEARIIQFPVHGDITVDPTPPSGITVVDAEIVDEAPAVTPSRELVVPRTPWRHVPDPKERAVVTVLKNAQHVPEARAARITAWKALGRFLLHHFIHGFGRGIERPIRVTKRWAHQTKARELALVSQKAGDWEKARSNSTRNTKVLAIAAIPVLVALLIFVKLASEETLYWTLGYSVLAVLLVGFQKRPKTDQTMGKAGLLGLGSIADLQAAMIRAGILKEDEELRPVQYPRNEGVGQAMVVDMPGYSWQVVRDKKAALAAQIPVDISLLDLWNPGHEAQLGLWLAHKDPFAGPGLRLPLMDATSWDSFKPAPFGITPRGTQIELCLMYANMLVGARPDAGKTYAARPVLAPYILDPRVRIFAANGKGDGAWEAIGDVAVEYVAGAGEEECEAVLAMLDQVRTEMFARQAALKPLRKSKVTADMADEYAPIMLVIDELQYYTEAEFGGHTLDGKAATIGQVIDRRLKDIVRGGRSAGVIMVLMTQKPTSDVISSQVRDQIAVRFALQTKSHYASNAILGTSASAEGFDSSKIKDGHQGVGILAFDSKAQVPGYSGGSAYPTMRTYFVDDDDWDALCARGAALRDSVGSSPVHLRSAAPEPAEPVDRVPEMLREIELFVALVLDHEKVSSRELLKEFGKKHGIVNDSAMGWKLRRWGCPSVKEGRGPNGPRAGDIRKACERIRSGGKIELEVST